MADKYQWPVEVPSVGTVINQMEDSLKNKAVAVLVPREQLQHWRWCLIECGALLDHDNPPSTPAQLAKMKPRNMKRVSTKS